MPEITETTVSRAWINAVAMAKVQPKKEISNFIVNIEGLDSASSSELTEHHHVLDQSLEANDKFSVITVANTIFPISLWDSTKPRNVLFERYLRLWPRIEAYRQNRRGTYFQRLISYPSIDRPALNQLEFVIGAYNSGTRRRSALQCSILVPHLDLNATPYQGFPCMQQLAFVPEGRTGLRISALYPMHYLWERAYGNYLGLINLGKFVAHEMGLELQAMTCIALVAKLERPEIAVPVSEVMSEIQ